MSKAHHNHSRHFKDNLYVYPVLSRRSKGISIGINLSPHKACNFDCLYCQVDRNQGLEKKIEVDEEILEKEILHMIELVESKNIFQMEPFTDTPLPLQRLNDIALSGDGEPTSESCFYSICQKLTQIQENFRLKHVKLVLISNSTQFHRPKVQEGVRFLKKYKGEIWAKLDAGTEEYYKLIDKSKVPFQRILDNISSIGRQHSITIQTLFTRFEGKRISHKEIQAYGEKLNKIKDSGAQIDEVQLHTVARKPADSRVSSLSSIELEDIKNQLMSFVQLNFQTFPG